MSFKDLKAKSGSFEKLQTELNKINTPTAGNFEDARLWKPDLDKTGNGYAILRFLPQPANEDLPWVRVWSHAFSGPGGWYIENSLTTLGKTDPVSEYNTELWNSGNDSDKEIARKQKRILKYFANVIVVSDPKHPENEGTVRLFRFGKKIFDKITEAMNPAFDDEEALNPFDYTNKLHGLQEFVDPKSFKTYDELKDKLNKVLTGTSVRGTVETFTPKTSVDKAVEQVKDVETEDDATLQYFAKLADEA